MSAAGIAGAGLVPTGALEQSPRRKLDRIGIQLYTVRSMMQESVDRTLAQIAEIGYHEVEFVGYFDRSPREIQSALSNVGLVAPAAHVSLELLENALDDLLDLAATVGHRYLVVAWIPPEQRTNIDHYRRVAEQLNRAADRARPAGVTIGYHNHDFEFERLDGQIPYDVLVDETHAQQVALEMDLFWITKGGADPFKYFREQAGRVQIVHVKDMAPNGTMVDVGRGEIDFAALFAQRDLAGTQHFFVEHDEPSDPYAFARNSFEYLQQLEFE